LAGPPPADDAVTSLLPLAESVAREAGALLRDAFAGPAVNVSVKSTATDPVSEADRAAERLIRSRLAAARPGDAVLGEEGGDTAGSSGVRWIVDPLDGTVNFLFGIPQWAVSVACEDADGPLAGVVYDPMRDELWSATRTGPALLDGSPVHVSSRSELATALVCTGFGYDADARRVQAEMVSRLLPAVRDIRRLGSAALDLAWTAAGRYDAFYEHGLNAWDLAAGALICERAGARRRSLPAGGPLKPGVLVSAPALLEPLASLLLA
jgi:myo-inositol-1(or 4)-monophosphatase